MPRGPALLLLPLLLAAAPGHAAGPEDFFPRGEELSPLAAGAPEHYTLETLWEKIDGEAELYRRFNLAAAAYLRYSHPDDEDETLEIGIYRFSSPLDAFGLYALSRPRGVPALPFGNGAVHAGHQGFMHHGPYFVSVDSFLEEGLRSRLVPETLRLVAERLGKSPPVFQFLVEIRKISGEAELRYLPDHVLGRKVFPPGLEFSSGPEKTFFVSTVPVDGEKVLGEYTAGLDGAGKEKINGITYLDGRDPALGSITLALRGDRLAGVRAAAASGEDRSILSDLLDVPLP